MKAPARATRPAWLVAVTLSLIAGVIFAWPTYLHYFAVYPRQLLIALVIAFVMYLPSFWLIRYLDRREPEPAFLVWGTILFVVLFAPIAARTMHSLINANIILYWQIVGPIEEITKVLPLLLIALLWRSEIGSMRDGFVYGALGGLGFAIIEFAANFAVSGYKDNGWHDLVASIAGRWAFGFDNHIIWGATTGAAIGYALVRRGRGASIAIALAIVVLVMFTHGFQDHWGKYIGPLSMVLLQAPLQLIGVDLTNQAESSSATVALLVFGSTVNLLIVNILIWPVLWWEVRYSWNSEENPVQYPVKIGELP